MRRFRVPFRLLVLGLCAGLFAPLLGADFKMANGNVLKGDLASADEDGLVVKLDIGGFSKREAWINLSQETLKNLAQDPKIAPMVEPFIELDPEELRLKEKEKEIVVKPVPTRIERPEGRIGLLAAFLTPLGLFLLAVLYAANLYAAYEVALYRRQPVAMVCGVAAVLPVIGPIIFMLLPQAQPGGTEDALPSPPEPVSPLAGAKPSTANVSAVPASGGLSLAGGGKTGAPGAGPAIPQTFTRGETTFNRRFFETKFPGFFRVVPSEAEKDLVLVLKLVKGEYVAKRISRIASNDMHVQVLNGGEVAVPFAEVTSVTLRHKDAKG